MKYFDGWLYIKVSTVTWSLMTVVFVFLQMWEPANVTSILSFLCAVFLWTNRKYRRT